MPSITISYDLHPPENTPKPGNLLVSQSHTFQVPASGDNVQGGTEHYYAELHKAIETARQVVGEELTQWKEAVGKGELSKELKKKSDEDGDDDEDDNEQPE